MKKHIAYLDFLRSFAVVMVLLLHSISPYITQPNLYGTTSWYINLALNALTRTGVPLFLMISGYLLLSSEDTEDFGAFYKKRILHILIPLIFWNIAYYVIKCVSGKLEFGFRAFFDSFINNGTEYHLWYLYTLIGIYLITPFLKIIVNQCSFGKLILLLSIMLFGTTIRPFVNAVTPLYIYIMEPLFNGYVACFFMGYVLGNIKTSSKVCLWFGFFGVLCFFVSCFYHNLHSSKDGINLIFNYGYSLCHYGLAASIFIVSKHFVTKPVPGARTFAKLSFGIYLVHVMIMDTVMSYFMIDASPVVSSGYIFAVAFGVSTLITYVLTKIKYLNKIVL